jgi:hypothetical protein
MNFQVEVVIKDDCGQETQRIVILEKHCGSMDAATGLGLNLTESKALVGTVQKHLLETQVDGALVGHGCCPKCSELMKRKDLQSIEYRTLFGKFTLPNARFFSCNCCAGQSKKSWSPLSACLATHTHPELLYLQARWAALIPYGQSLRLLQDVLPLEGAISSTNMKLTAPMVGQRIEADRAKQVCAMAVPDGETPQTATSGEQQIATSLSVGVDAGYIRSNAAKGEGSRKFGVIAVKTVEANSRCHADVQTEVDDGSERISNFIEQGRDSR